MKIYKAVEMCLLILQNTKILKTNVADQISTFIFSLFFFRVLVDMLSHLQIPVFFENVI